MTQEQILQAVKSGAKEALKEELGNFYIDREIHYQDHQFITGLREWTEAIKCTALKTFVRGIIGVFLILIVLGFIYWGKSQWQ